MMLRKTAASARLARRRFCCTHYECGDIPSIFFLTLFVAFCCCCCSCWQGVSLLSSQTKRMTVTVLQGFSRLPWSINGRDGRRLTPVWFVIVHRVGVRPNRRRRDGRWSNTGVKSSRRRNDALVVDRLLLSEHRNIDAVVLSSLVQLVVLMWRWCSIGRTACGVEPGG